MCVCERERERESLSRLRLLVTPWTVAHQAVVIGSGASRFLNNGPVKFRSENMRELLGEKPFLFGSC